MLRRLLNSLYKATKKLGLYDSLAPMFSNIEKYVRGAGLRITPVEGYIALIVVSIILCPILGIVIGALLAVEAVKHLNLALALLASLAVLAGFGVPAVLIAYPLLAYQSRTSKLQARILYLLLFTSALLSGGYGIEKTMLRLYARREVLGFEVELSDIAKQLVLGGEDVARALRTVASYTPSHELAMFLEGLAGLSETGTGVLAFVKTFFNNILFRMETLISEVTNNLSLIAEVFVAGAVVLPCIVASLLLGIVVTGGVGIDPYLLLGAVTFAVTPIITAATWLLVDLELSRVRG